MKTKFFNILLIILVFIVFLLYFNNTNNKNLPSNKSNYIIGTITYLDDFSLEIISPNNEEYILIIEKANKSLPKNLSVGDNIKAYYSDEIMESDPAQVVIDFIEKIE